MVATPNAIGFHSSLPPGVVNAKQRGLARSVHLVGNLAQWTQCPCAQGQYTTRIRTLRGRHHGGMTILVREGTSSAVQGPAPTQTTARTRGSLKQEASSGFVAALPVTTGTLRLRRRQTPPGTAAAVLPEPITRAPNQSCQPKLPTAWGRRVGKLPARSTPSTPPSNIREVQPAKPVLLVPGPRST